MPKVPAERLREIGAALLMANKVPEDEAATVARHVVNANLAGHDSHGVIMLPSYIERVRVGHIVPGAPFTVVQESPTTTVVDGNWGFGYVINERAMALTIEKAETSNIAACTVFRQGHVGRLASYPLMAAAAGMIGMAWADSGRSPKSVAPFGGREARLGTNPWAVAVPSDLKGPLVLDMATSAVAVGKVKLAEARGEPIPRGWVVDSEGRLATDPTRLAKGGALLPLGGPGEGYKGTGPASFMKAHDKEVKPEELKDAVLDEKNNVYYQPKKDKEGKVEMKDGKPVADTTKAIGVRLADGKVYKGWKTPNLVINLFSKKWEDAFKGEGLPRWSPSTQAKEGEFLAFPYKYPTITHTRNGNSKWLRELRSDNPVLMNPVDAQKLGVQTGDRVEITSKVSSQQWNVEVTEGVMPGTLGFGWGPGRWAAGAFATAGKDTKDAHCKDISAELVKADADYGRIWWKDGGTSFNWLPELKADLIGGAQEYTVAVTIKKV